MATTLTYTVAPYVPFTKIQSANANQDKTDIKNRINWAGGTSTTTGLGDDNLQSNTVSGGGLTRATKLKLGTAYAVVVNSSTGAMTEVIPVVSTALQFDASGHPVAAVLPLAAGGTGSVITNTTQNNVLQFNGSGQLVSQAIPGGSSNPIFAFRNFT